MVALVFKGTLTMKKKPAKMFVAAHHCITSNEFLDDIMDEILVSVIFLIVCTYEFAEKVHFIVLNSIMKLCRSV